jgi:hypothetical protein
MSDDFKMGWPAAVAVSAVALGLGWIASSALRPKARRPRKHRQHLVRGRSGKNPKFAVRKLVVMPRPDSQAKPTPDGAA